jgi:hypothetical protein
MPGRPRPISQARDAREERFKINAPAPIASREGVARGSVGIRSFLASDEVCHIPRDDRRPPLCRRRDREAADATYGTTRPARISWLLWRRTAP